MPGQGTICPSVVAISDYFELKKQYYSYYISMQEPQEPLQNRPEPVLLQPHDKDPLPFFFKVIVTIILGLAALSILQPETRKALANLSKDVFFRGQLWRLFTTEFVTFSAVDCIFALFFAYTSIGKFEKRVGSIVFIFDFILIGLLMAGICATIGLFENFLIDGPSDEIQMRHNSGFFGLYFFYLSRLHYLEPDREMPLLCLVIKQRNFPPILFLLLLALTSFRVPLIVTVAYLLVIIEDNFFKGRYFTFNSSSYIRGEIVLKCFSGRDDFYKIEECRESLSFFRDINEFHRFRLYRAAQELLRRIMQRNPAIINLNVEEQGGLQQMDHNDNQNERFRNDLNQEEEQQRPLASQSNHTNVLEPMFEAGESLIESNDSVQEIKIQSNDEQFQV